MLGRREFLGGSAVGLAGLLLPGCRLFDPRRPAFGPEVRAEFVEQEVALVRRRLAGRAPVLG